MGNFVCYVIGSLKNEICMILKSIIKFCKSFFFFDCYLMFWIFLAMVVGVGLGYFLFGIVDLVNFFFWGSINILIVIGFILMMYLFLVKVNYCMLL